MGFPDSSIGKESACNAGDPGSIPRLGKSAGEGIGYSPQYSRASLMAQLVKNLPAIWGKERKKKKVKLIGHVQLFATPWTVARQASPSMEFSRHEYWSGLSFQFLGQEDPLEKD